MISDAALAQLCAATYTDAPTIPVPATGTDARITVADGIAVVAFRGSVTAEDWARDFFFAPVAIRTHPQLGDCHAGFLDAAASIADEVDKAIGGRCAVITGHSLGGAIAVGVGALLLLAAKPPLAIVTFGCPRFGMARFAAAMANLPIRQYVRGDDIVPDAPEYVAPLFPFVDTRDPRIAVGAAPTIPPAARFDVIGQIRRGALAIEAALACHAIAGYVADVAAYLKAAKPELAVS